MEKNSKELSIQNIIAKNKISWSAVIAGLITFLVIFIMLTILSFAIGFGAIGTTVNNGLDSLGVGVTILTISTFSISFMLAGFISGLGSNNLGLIHGFLTWATGILMIIIIVSYTTIGTLSAVGSLFGSVTVNVGESFSTLTSSLAKKIGSSINYVSNDLNLINIDNFDEDMGKILKDTRVKELQPGYLKNEIDESINIIKEAGKKTLIHPEESEKIINYAAQELKTKSKNIGKAIDKEAISNSVTANTDLTDEEAKQVTDNIYNKLKSSSEKIKNKIEDTSQNLKNVNIYLKSTIDDVKQIASEVAESTSKASTWTFVAMLLSLIITSLSGWLGSILSKR